MQNPKLCSFRKVDFKLCYINRRKIITLITKGKSYTKITHGVKETLHI